MPICGGGQAVNQASSGLAVVVVNTYFLQMIELEKLGYSAFAFGYFEDDTQFSGTASARCCANSQIIEYLHSVIVAGKQYLLGHLPYALSSVFIFHL